MVALDSRNTPDPPRTLSAELRERLGAAIDARWRGEPGAEPHLAEVLQAVAAEARMRGLRPEEVIVLLKQLEDDVAAQRHAAGRPGAEERRRLRDRLITTMLEAYFRP